jgi:dTDP-4-amino-4,6-dideoxygalactose transaminase
VAEGGIEDAAHCYPGQAGVGAGRAQCWSLHGTKIITCGEGGMLTTDEEPLAREARLMRRHGIEALASGAREASYDVALRGDNWAMDDIRAAIVRVQLRRLEQLLAWRREAFEAYRDRLGGMLIDSPSYHLAVVRLPHGTDRAAVRARLTEAGIATSVHYPPVHMLTSYRWERMAYQPGLPVTEDLAPRLLTLPLHAEMVPDEAEAVAEEVLSCVR